MSLEDYKQKVADYLKETYPAFTLENRRFQSLTEEDWLEYMEDFSPEVMAQGVASGLI